MTAGKDQRAIPAKPVGAGSAAPGVRVTLVGTAVNIFLVILKLWGGFVSGSQALIADGIDSISDLFSNFVVILGLKWGQKQEDENHPYGHARIETISGMVVGIVLLLVGLGIAANAISSIYHHRVSRPGILAIWAAAISIILKEGLYWYTIVIGRRLKSLALIAMALNYRTDAFSTVAVLIGVGATYLKPAWHLADSYAALVVTFFVIRVSLRLVHSALRELSDTAPKKEVVIQLTNEAIQILGVRQVHDLRARYSGPQIFVELHIVVDPSITVRQGHAIAREVRHRLLNEFTDVTRVIVHVDPELKEAR